MVFGLHRCVFHCFGTRTTILSTGTCDTFRADCPPTGWTNKFVRGDPEVRHKGLWNVEGAPSRPSGNEVAPGTPFAYTALGVPRGWPRSSLGTRPSCASVARAAVGAVGFAVGCPPSVCLSKRRLPFTTARQARPFALRYAPRVDHNRRAAQRIVHDVMTNELRLAGHGTHVNHASANRERTRCHVGWELRSRFLSWGFCVVADTNHGQPLDAASPFFDARRKRGLLEHESPEPEPLNARGAVVDDVAPVSLGQFFSSPLAPRFCSFQP